MLNNFICKISEMKKIIAIIICIGFIYGCATTRNGSASVSVPDGWEYVEMANGEIILYEPVKEKGGQILYSPYNPNDPDGNHRELKGHEVRWQPLLTKKEIESKRWLQRKYKQ